MSVEDGAKALEIAVYRLVGNGTVKNQEKLDKLKLHAKQMDTWINQTKCNGKDLDIVTSEGTVISKGHIKDTEAKIEKYCKGIAKTIRRECKGIPDLQAKKFCETLETDLDCLEDGITLVDVMNPTADKKTMFLAKMVVGWNKTDDEKIDVAKCAYYHEKILKTPGYIWAIENWKNNEDKIQDWLTVQLLKKILEDSDYSDLNLGIE